MNLGQQIRRIRRAAGDTQGRMAARLGCSATCVVYMETGRRQPSLEMLATIRTAYGIDPYLLALLPEVARHVAWDKVWQETPRPRRSDYGKPRAKKAA